MLRSIAYVSCATRAYSLEDLDVLLVDARMFNASVEVTGVLFYDAGKFFQYIEGSDTGLVKAYQRIQRATSHTRIEKLLDTKMKRRYFETWHMGFCKPPETAIQKLANARWEKSMPITRDEFEGFEGLSLAAYYWNKWSAEKSRSS